MLYQKNQFFFLLQLFHSSFLLFSHSFFFYFYIFNLCIIYVKLFDFYPVHVKFILYGDQYGWPFMLHLLDIISFARTCIDFLIWVTTYQAFQFFAKSHHNYIIHLFLLVKFWYWIRNYVLKVHVSIFYVVSISYFNTLLKYTYYFNIIIFEVFISQLLVFNIWIPLYFVCIIIIRILFCCERIHELS